MATKRKNQNNKNGVKYAVRQIRSARVREDDPLPMRGGQAHLNGFEKLSAGMEQPLGTAASVALHNALRRYGIEGEEAFLVLASRYLETRKIAVRSLLFFPVERGIAALNIVAHDKQVIAVLDGIVASDPEGRELPTWYQFFFGRRFREGSGKFFTPRTVAAAMAKLLPVQPDAVLMDPTCGGGTFLREASRRWQGVRCRLVGNDVDRMLVGLTELLLALSAPDSHDVSLSCCNLYDADSEFRHLRGKVDGILANPPFSLPLERVARPGDLFALGYRNSDALFLDVCLELLAPGGSLVCLLPHSLVVNGEFEPMRKTAEKHWDLCGVVTLPEGVFYLTGNTTTRADIVHLKKKAARHHPIQKSFFANAPTVGFPLNSRAPYFGDNSLDLIADDPRVLDCVGAER